MADDYKVLLRQLGWLVAWLLCAVLGLYMGPDSGASAAPMLALVMLGFAVAAFIGVYVYLAVRAPEQLCGDELASWALPVAGLLGGLSFGMALTGPLGGLLGGAVGLWVGVASQRSPG